ncbi:hypothetical protein M011DRAFT_492975 [Sporormia fimetaria CBS 119925]|uniref:Heme haloperoxidase family profile domain-containing protein n=1 Tax=Sporormia fimetaria CBS 119925 TaxID=1340428 RepID=A0A6A6VJL8_9PLEO|nr:hypothetical protein M011DRAFT_492975 [Sporormia fimetaria CBS 119925]
MKVRNILLLALPALSSAYPGMMGASKEEIDAMLIEKRFEEEKRDPQIIAPILGSLLGTIRGLLGSVASAVDLNNKRPEPGFEFRAPGPGDSRGPCPGLNLLANHGYLPRNGKVTFGQVVQATARGFNMGADLATVLATFAVLTDGDIVNESFYLGSPPGKVGGLNRHSTVETDVSVHREDYYNGCGDNHHLSSRLWKQNVAIVARSQSKLFDMENMAQQYAANARFSQINNPYLYYFPFPMIVSLGAFAFYPNFFSNGTYGAGGVPNYESVSSIVGAEYDDRTREFKYVPERFPPNWYRRAVPYTAANALADGYLRIYPKYPLVPGVAQLGGPNFSVQTVLCDAYQGIQSIIPLLLANDVENVAAKITWAQSKITGLLGGTVLGCDRDTLSPTVPFFPNATRTGGPLGTPSAQVSNIGDNVYGKVYFRNAPTRPQCNPSQN